MWRNYFVILLLVLATGCWKKPPPAETHDFGFPLVYNIEVPEVPERLLKPSPPIEDSPSPAEKASKESEKSAAPVKASPPAKEPSTPPARKS